MSELRWADEKAVSKWVERELKADSLALMEAPRRGRPLSRSEAYARVAVDALEMAERGDMNFLVEVLDPNCKFNNPETGERPLRSYLPPGAWQFIMDALTGVRNPRTGRRKEDRGNGKPACKRGPAERMVEGARKYTPVGSYFRIVEKLRAKFPEQKQKDIKSRALSIASEKWWLSENTLANKLKKAERRKKRDPYSAK